MYAPKCALDMPGSQLMQKATASRSFPSATSARIVRSSRWQTAYVSTVFSAAL
ncbi:hypothetical protein [Streptomyces sp. NPDC001381]|uniref:hypothetical protein n=1 Tax=Streptomyces sp. NPDC001381 TaxID=3364567 RepID=UPI0036745289